MDRAGCRRAGCIEPPVGDGEEPEVVEPPGTPAARTVRSSGRARQAGSPRPRRRRPEGRDRSWRLPPRSWPRWEPWRSVPRVTGGAALGPGTVRSATRPRMARPAVEGRWPAGSEHLSAAGDPWRADPIHGSSVPGRPTQRAALPCAVPSGRRSFPCRSRSVRTRPSSRAGDWVIVSGQVGCNDGVLADGVAAQTAQAIENLQRAAGHDRVPR